MIVRKLKTNQHYEVDKRQSFKQLDRLVVHLEGCIRILNFEHIEYIKADSNYSNIYLTNGEKILVSRTLKSLLAELDNTFLRTHKSYIANMRCMTAYHMKDSLITMISGDQLDVSRANKSILKRLMVR